MFGLLSAVAQAQNALINWQTPATISGASDVSTLGTYLGSWAPYDGSANTLPVNGVTFQGFSDLSGLSPVNFDNGYTGFGSPGTANVNYNSLLQCATFSNESTPNSLTWGGMTAGDSYLVELWVNDGRNIGQARSETFTGGGSISANVLYGSDGSGPGEYIIGEFVADSTGTETIDVTPYSSGANPDPQLNLFQVRDITPTPEPSTIALTATGAAALLLGLRRRGNAR
jgi:hypothetical protein